MAKRFPKLVSDTKNKYHIRIVSSMNILAFSSYAVVITPKT